MHTIKNSSFGRQQVRTLDQGLVFMDPGDTLTASIETTYARLLRRSLSLSISDATENAAPGLEKALPSATGPETHATPTEQPETGLNGDVPELPADDDKAGWVKLATSKGIDVKKSWGVNRIKTELEQLG